MARFKSITSKQVYPPLCLNCGGRTTLAHVEIAPDKHHDLRTFKCRSCGRSEVVMVRFGSADYHTERFPIADAAEPLCREPHRSWRGSSS